MLTETQAASIAQDAARLAVAGAAIDREELRDIVGESVRQTLVQLGIATDEPIAMQRDMQHLRAWREGMDSVKKKGLLTIAGFVIVAFIVAAVLGFKELFHHPEAAKPVLELMK